MTTLQAPAPTKPGPPLTAARLPASAPALAGAIAVGLGGLVVLLAGWGLAAFAVVTTVVFLLGYGLWALKIEGTRGATDRMMTAMLWVGFTIAMIPLLWLIWTVVSNGLPEVNGKFLTYDMRNVIGAAQGGIYHAIMGTLLVTLAAMLISVPVGLLCAIYLVEYGGGGRMARWLTFLIDVMTGIPSIVAGLFALALFVLIMGPDARLGFGGSVALSLLMIPIVVRATEEMLRLVPDELREASYALGVPKWRTIVKVVLPTSMGGIITGVMLATARVIGETAPLLVIAGKTDSVNFNLFGERMTTLPVYIYYSFTQPGAVPIGAPPGAEAPGIARAWGAALVLVAIVLGLSLLARLIGRVAVKKG